MITPNIPIVGQPLEVVHFEVSAIAYCNCDPTDRTMMVLAHERPVICPKCGTQFVLRGMPHHGSLDISIRPGQRVQG